MAREPPVLTHAAVRGPRSPRRSSFSERKELIIIQLSCFLPAVDRLWLLLSNQPLDGRTEEGQGLPNSFRGARIYYYHQMQLVLWIFLGFLSSLGISFLVACG